LNALAIVVGVIGVVAALFWFIIWPIFTRGAPSLVIYSDLPREIVDPIIHKFESQRKIHVRVVYADKESVNSGVGLSDRIRKESAKPIADIYWSACPVAVEQLRRDSLLEPHTNTTIDRMFAGPQAMWWGLGTRVRVIVWNKNRLNRNTAPKSMCALARPEWMSRCAMADPSKNGSSRYHVWLLFTTMTPSEARHILEQIKQNRVQLPDTDNGVVDAVASGKADWGVADSDDAYRAMQQGKPVDYAVSDQVNYSTQDALGVPHGAMPTMGTPLLSYAMALVHNRPHVRDTYDLAGFLYTDGVAADMQEADPAIIPTSMAIVTGLGESRGHIINPDDLRPLAGTIAAISDSQPEADKAIQEVFGGIDQGL
jgi:ABC-type Fe3+ transport system substrate-binding protein